MHPPFSKRGSYAANQTPSFKKGEGMQWIKFLPLVKRGLIIRSAMHLRVESCWRAMRDTA